MKTICLEPTRDLPHVPYQQRRLAIRPSTVRGMSLREVEKAARVAAEAASASEWSYRSEEAACFARWARFWERRMGEA